MLKRTIVAIGIFAGVSAALAFLQWWIVRLQREAAPLPNDLLLDPDETVRMTRENPTCIRVSWQKDNPPVRIYLKTSADTPTPQTPDALVTTQWVTFDNVDAFTRYFADIQFGDGTIITLAERTVPMQAAPNFRDIGGYITQDGHQVRWGKIYRASALDRLTQTDQKRLADMCIMFACDMRTYDEVAAAPDKLPSSIEYRNIAVQNDDSRLMAVANILFNKDYLPNLLRDLYTRITLDENPQVFTDLFQLIADNDNLPLVIHCAAGKDRTGIATALILSLLGVDDDTIIADYTQSNHHYDFFRQAGEKVMKQLTLFGVSQSDFDYLLIADARVMRYTLDHLYSTYGSAENYLINHAGIDAETIARIRHNLLI